MSDTSAASSGVLTRLRRRLVPRSAVEVEAAELLGTAQRTGACSVEACVAGEKVVVCGTVRTLTLRPRAGVPALEAELYDGSGRILLIWLGRREIGGIEPGRVLVAQGRATQGRDSLVIYNPAYQLRPEGA
jgi:hypothetical protein